MTEKSGLLFDQVLGTNALDFFYNRKLTALSAKKMNG